MRFLNFFKRQLLITHIYGIPVRIDYRWFLVLALMTWLTVANIPNSLVENGIAKFLLGFITILVFFVSIIIHELGHSYVARKEGIEVLEILLHPFGGLARLRREPDTPRAEFRIAIAGPLASFLIALVFFGLFLASTYSQTHILTPSFFVLFLLNLMLAIFNLFPGYPLDGGRVLRAFLWHRGTDLNEATVLTGRFGQIIAGALIFFGIVMIFLNREIFTGIWTILVGMFLFDAAYEIIRKVNNFDNLLVENIMEIPISVTPETSIMEFVDKTLPLYRKVSFPVAQDKQLFGFLLLEDVKKNLTRDKWHTTKIKDAMRPIREDYFIESNSLVESARQLLQINDLGVLGVIDEKGDLVGIISQNKLQKR